MEKDGEVIRLARELYQLPDAELDANHSLAGAAKRFPKGVICLVSELAFHGLTDQLPKKVWMATGRNAWTPKPSDMPIRVLRFSDDLLADRVETHVIEGVSVKVRRGEDRCGLLPPSRQDRSRRRARGHPTGLDKGRASGRERG